MRQAGTPDVDEIVYRVGYHARNVPSGLSRAAKSYYGRRGRGMMTLLTIALLIVILWGAIYFGGLALYFTFAVLGDMWRMLRRK